jgi:hypothetical protein
VTEKCAEEKLKRPERSMVKFENIEKVQKSVDSKNLAVDRINQKQESNNTQAIAPITQIGSGMGRDPGSYAI